MSKSAEEKAAEIASWWELKSFKGEGLLRDRITEALRQERAEAIEQCAKEAEGNCGLHPDYWTAARHGAACTIAMAIRANISKEGK